MKPSRMDKPPGIRLLAMPGWPMHGLLSGAIFMLLMGLWNGNLGSSRNLIQGALFGVGMAFFRWLAERRAQRQDGEAD